MLEKCGVYLILCKPTGEIYIGGTRSSFRERFKGHLISLRRRGCSPPLLQAAWDLYGEDAFEFKPLKDFPPDEVADREREAIERLRPALNTVPKRNTKFLKYQRDYYRRKYRREKGLDQNMPPHMAGRRWQVGEDLLTLAEIAVRAGMDTSTISERIKRGLTGEALVAPKHRAPRKPYRRK